MGVDFKINSIKITDKRVPILEVIHQYLDYKDASFMMVWVVEDMMVWAVEDKKDEVVVVHLRLGDKF